MVAKYGGRAKPVGWRGESYRHYLATKGISKHKPYQQRYNHNDDLSAFKARYANRTVTSEEFRAQSKKALKIGILGIDEGKFKPMELLLPSNKNEAETAKAIFLGVQLRKQNKARLNSAKTAQERARIRKEIQTNDKFRGRLK